MVKIFLAFKKIVKELNWHKNWVVGQSKKNLETKQKKMNNGAEADSYLFLIN